MGNREPIWSQIHYPALAVCLGAVFMAPPLYKEQGNLICAKWTILSVALICACTLYGIMRHRDDFASEGKIAKSVYLVGVVEVVISFLQSTKVLVSYNPFFAFTGTFSNPSMLAMLLSVCIPIGVFYVRQHASRGRLLWIVLTLGMVACLLFSASRTCILAVFAACVVFSLETGCSLLHQCGRYAESASVLAECTELYNDYNVQMLLGDNLRQQGMLQEAVERFSQAERMIPSRFLPLYYEMETYMENGEEGKGRHVT